LSRNWIPLALAVFGVGSFLGVTIAGRLSDRRPGLVLAIGGPLLTAGWMAMALSQALPVALILLVFVQGLLAFGVGTTVISRALQAATDAPTMGGSYATAALNIGAAGGPVVGGLSLSSDLGTSGPLWVAAALTGTALVLMTLCRPI